jgi:hypothetical protein
MLADDLRRATRPPAEFRGLSLDVTDPRREAEFWSAALGSPAVRDDDGQMRISPAAGRPPTEILRLRKVTGSAPDGACVHLDLRLAGSGPEALLRAGASVVRHPGTDPWWVLADPEGNQLCAFPAVDDRPAGVFELVVKCRDAGALARWWAAVLGGTAADEGDAAVVTGAVDLPWDYMVFDPVPDVTMPPNRLRWHVDLRDATPADLVHRGAVLLAAGPSGWLLSDPEGNEFFATLSGGRPSGPPPPDSAPAGSRRASAD